MYGFIVIFTSHLCQRSIHVCSQFKFKRVGSSRPACGRRKLVQASAEQPKKNKFQLPDFNRNYYDELKAEYADDPNITIFSKDDYTLDPIIAPWLYENRGRDLKAIRKKVQERIEDAKSSGTSEQADDPDGFPPDALQWTDLHTEDEIASFRTRAQTEDPVTGRVWSNPMTESEIDLAAQDDNIIRFRPDSDDAPSIFPLGDDVNFWGDSPSSESEFMFPEFPEDFDDLQESWHHLNAAKLDTTDDTIAYGEHIPAPNPEDYRHWQEEAERRGGNATVADSYDLPPYRDIYKERREALESTKGEQLPPQHDTLVSAHSGMWVGHLNIFALHTSDRKFKPVLEQMFLIQTDISLSFDRDLQFHTTIQIDDEELLTDSTFSSFEFRNGVVRGRSVAADASYICVSSGNPDPKPIFSLPRKALIKMMKNSSLVEPVVEVGILRRSDSKPIRYRVILIANGPKPSSEKHADKSKGHSPKFSHVVLIAETRIRSLREASDIICRYKPRQLDLPVISLSEIKGRWTGKAILLQPEYPIEGTRQVETTISLMHAVGVQQSDVTWVENELELSPNEKSKRQERQKGKKKVSARVAAARAYDQSRLSSCNLLCHERIGDSPKEEKHVWNTMPQGRNVSWFFSPRIGRFIDDYAGLVLTNKLWLTFPLTKAFPTMWNTISLVEIASPTRRRIVVGRNEDGTLVGALFATETLEDSDKMDSVSCYV